MPVMYARNTYDGVLSYDIPQALDTDVVELPIDRSLNFITQAGERVMLMPRLDGKGFQTVFGARALESVWRLGDEGHALGYYLTRAGLDFQTEHDAAPEDVAALALLLKTEGFPFSQTIYVKGPNTLLPEVITEISLPRTYDPASKSIIGGQSAHLVVKA